MIAGGALRLSTHKKFERLKTLKVATVINIMKNMTKKFDGDVRLLAVSQTQLATFLGITTGRVNQLIDEGVVIRDPSSHKGEVLLCESIQNYDLSGKTSGDAVNFWKERGLHEKAKRELAELKLAERKGELYEAATVDDFLTELIVNTRNKLMGAGHKTALQCEGKSAAQISDIIDAEIREILTELATGAKSDGYKTDAGEMDAAAADDG